MATPLTPITLAWLIGIWGAARITLPTVALGIAAGAILTWRMPKPHWFFVLALAAILGALRFNLAQPHFDQTALVTYNDQPKSVIVGGIIAAEPDARDTYTNLRVEADHLLISNLDGVTRTVRGLVLVQAPPFTDFRYGDRVRTEGKLKTPTNMGDFDYREYLARQDVYSIMSRPRVMSLARDQGFAPFAWLAPFWQSVARCKTKPDVTFVLVGILSGKNRHRDIA